VSGSPSGAGWSTWWLVCLITGRSQAETVPLLTYFVTPHSVLWYNARGKGQRAAKETPRFMAYIHAIAAGHLELALYAVSLLVSALPEKILSLIWMRGFGRRGFGRGFGSFRLLRILFTLLFTTLLGPIVLVALITFIAYRFFVNRRGR
jgi:hypothetical protein